MTFIFKQAIFHFCGVNSMTPYPFNAQEEHMVLFHQNSNSILRKDHQKISYERQAC